MKYIAFILNVPWTILGAVLSIVSIPREVSFNHTQLAFVVRVRSFWWLRWIPGKRYVRAITNGHLIQLGPLEEDRDLVHELIHVEQAMREPFIHPLLYLVESIRHGYKNNKYEVAAYEKAGNIYNP